MSFFWWKCFINNAKFYNSKNYRSEICKSVYRTDSVIEKEYLFITLAFSMPRLSSKKSGL